MARGQPYALEGEFVEVDPPRRLVHTWHVAGAPEAATTVTYVLEQFTEGTRLTVRHSGFQTRESAANSGTRYYVPSPRCTKLDQAGAAFSS